MIRSAPAREMLHFLLPAAMAMSVEHCPILLFGVDGDAPRNAAVIQSGGDDWNGADGGFEAFLDLHHLAQNLNHAEGTTAVFVANDGSFVSTITTYESGLWIWRPREHLTPGFCYDLRVRLPDGELLGGLMEPVCITDHVDTRPPRLGPIRDVRWLSATVDYGAVLSGPPLVVDYVQLALGFDEAEGGTRYVALYSVSDSGPDRARRPWIVRRAPFLEERRYVVVRSPAGCGAWAGGPEADFRVGETEYLRVDPYDLAGNRGPSVYFEATWTGDATTSTVRRVSARRARRWGR